VVPGCLALFGVAKEGYMTKRALITGITGQDGSYLAEFLLGQGYEVAGMVRRSSVARYERLAAIQDRVTLLQGDLLDPVSLVDVLRTWRPQEVYNRSAELTAKPGGAVLRAHVLEPADAHRGVQRPGRDLSAGRYSDGRPRDAVLPGVQQRDVWQGARGAAVRDDAVLPPQPLWRGQSVIVT